MSDNRAFVIIRKIDFLHEIRLISIDFLFNPSQTSYRKKRHFYGLFDKINKNDKLLNRYIDIEKPIKTELQKKEEKNNLSHTSNTLDKLWSGVFSVVQSRTFNLCISC